MLNVECDAHLQQHGVGIHHVSQAALRHHHTGDGFLEQRHLLLKHVYTRHAVCQTTSSSTGGACYLLPAPGVRLDHLLPQFCLGEEAGGSGVGLGGRLHAAGGAGLVKVVQQLKALGGDEGAVGGGVGAC